MQTSSLSPSRTRFAPPSCIIRLLLLLSLLGLTSCNSQKVSVEEKSTQTISVSGEPLVIIQTFNGQVDIRNDAEGEISVEVTKVGVGDSQAEARSDLKSIDVDVKQEAGTITILATCLEDMVVHDSEARLVVSVPVAAKLNVASGMGDISFWGVYNFGEYAFRTGNGSIEIYLPEAARFQINALAGNGKIISDFLVSPTVEGSQNILNGASGDDPGLSITATTSNGDIGIHRDK